jgi:hypothetical protein
MTDLRSSQSSYDTTVDDFVQTFEVSVIDMEAELSAQLAWIPRSAVSSLARFFWDENGGPIFPTPSIRLAWPDVSLVQPVVRAQDLPRFIQDLFVHSVNDHAGPRALQVVELSFRFSEYLAYAEILPHPSSTLSVRSLAATLVGPSPTGVGVLVSFASGETTVAIGTNGGLVLLFTVPDGIILCSAAAQLGPDAADLVREVARRLLSLPAASKRWCTGGSHPNQENEAGPS